MMDQWIETLVERAIEAGLIDEQDRIYCRNRVLARLQKLDFTRAETAQPGRDSGRVGASDRPRRRSRVD